MADRWLFQSVLSIGYGGKSIQKLWLYQWDPLKTWLEPCRVGALRKPSELEAGTEVWELPSRKLRAGGWKNRGSCFHHCVHPGNVFIEPSHFLMLILKGFKNFPKLHIRRRTDTMRKSAHIRANLNAYAHICRHTRTHAHIRTRMSTYAHICRMRSRGPCRRFHNSRFMLCV